MTNTLNQTALKRPKRHGIESVEAKRSPLSPDFNRDAVKIKKSGDNSDRKIDPVTVGTILRAV
ncbi:hypothetical protein PA598K_06151 [Paenibacillus sp. 598K]|nr:hypothetical protein PA598K_06151 [Paenibacillus sp. 598K]